MDAEASDDELLGQARAGDRAALEALLARVQPRVFRFGAKMCRDPRDAEDVLQETLLAMARGLRDFRGAASLSTWLYTIARSHCIKRARKGKHEPATLASLADLSETAEPADGGRAPDELASARQVERALAEAIAALEPAQREVLLLRDGEGLSAPQVAEVVGASVEAVKSRLHRARLAVRARMAPLLQGGDQPPAAAGPCPDVLSLYSRYVEGEISADLCAEMERHLEGCPRCRASCDSLKRTLALCRATPQGPVPEPVATRVRFALRDFLSEVETHGSI